MRQFPGTLLFIGLLLAYNVNLRQVSSHDTYASRFVPISILRDGDLILDEFVPEPIRVQAGNGFLGDYFAYTRGHFYDSHSPVGPLLALPVYALPVWIGIPESAELAANLFSKLSASLMAAFSALVVFGASRRYLRAAGQPRETQIALLAALAYGLATSVWSTASLAIWTHTPAVLGYAVMLWALTAGRTGLAGAAAAAAVIARPATAPAVALLAIYLAHRTYDRTTGWGWASGAARASLTDLVRFCSAAAATGIAGVIYNYWLFGNAVGGAPFRTGYWVEELGTQGMFSGSLPAGLAGLTLSPNRGILIFSPIVVFAIAGAVRVWRSAPIPSTSDLRFGHRDALLLARYASLAALVILLTYSKFIAWWGGHGFGPRYLTDAMPFLGLLFAAGFAPLFDRRARLRTARVAATVLLCYSISIQAIGAFCWPSPWTLDNTVSPYRFRLWDWRGSEIEMCIRSGPRVDPAAQRLLRRVGF